MNMSTDVQTVNAIDAGIERYFPLAELPDGTEIAPGNYALGISTGSGGFYITGTPHELDAWVIDARKLADEILAFDLEPLRLSDFKPDEDGDFQCPRCDVFFEVGEFGDFAELASAIDDHAASHQPPPPPTGIDAI